MCLHNIFPSRRLLVNCLSSKIFFLVNTFASSLGSSMFASSLAYLSPQLLHSLFYQISVRKLCKCEEKFKYQKSERDSSESLLITFRWYIENDGGSTRIGSKSRSSKRLYIWHKTMQKSMSACVVEQRTRGNVWQFVCSNSQFCHNECLSINRQIYAISLILNNRFCMLAEI